MNAPKTTDRRLNWQLVTLVLLTALPVMAIAANGLKTLRAIFTPAAESLHSDATLSESNADLPETDTPEPMPKPQPLMFGVYDPEGVFADDKNLLIRHIYLSWADFDEEAVKVKLQALEQQGFQPLLTIEPWPMPDSERPLLPAIANGDYDDIIDRIANILNTLQGPVYLSWGHEMDQDMTERYPWSGKDPEQFLGAYRYVVDRIRKRSGLPISWVWAGVLKEGSLAYWPGDDYADFIGMPIYSFPEWDRQAYGYIRDFPSTFYEKRKIVAELNKPLLITEMGVAGSSDFQSFWLHQAFLRFEEYPDLVGVIFFHSKDADGAWGKAIRTPDWRQHPGVVRGLVEWNLR